MTRPTMPALTCADCTTRIRPGARNGRCRPCQYKARGFPPASLQPRVYLDVPFEERGAARMAGCRFDPNEHAWFFVRSSDYPSLPHELADRWHASATTTPTPRPRRDRADRFLQQHSHHA